jgi:acyl-CoA reductase-like NAD-dependent aldehyde dehydrogenase
MQRQDQRRSPVPLFVNTTSKTVATSRREQIARNTMAYQTVNPYDNQVVATFDDLTDERLVKLIAQAQKTFESWGQKSFSERTAVCKRAAAILTERPDEFARLLKRRNSNHA